MYGLNGLEMAEFDAVTADGVPIVNGLRVWTNNLDRGRVILNMEDPPGWGGVDLELHPDAAPEYQRVWWFYVQTDQGGYTLQDGSRVTTRWRGELA